MCFCFFPSLQAKAEPALVWPFWSSFVKQCYILGPNREKCTSSTTPPSVSCQVLDSCGAGVWTASPAEPQGSLLNSWSWSVISSHPFWWQIFLRLCPLSLFTPITTLNDLWMICHSDCCSVSPTSYKKQVPLCNTVTYRYAYTFLKTQLWSSFDLLLKRFMMMFFSQNPQKTVLFSET